MHGLRSTLTSWREYITPVATTSSFKSTGTLTPEEFVTAGDYLVYKFPTWSWSGASEGGKRDYLPEGKQFLVTKHVPCMKRPSALEAATADEFEIAAEDGEGEEGWLAPVSQAENITSAAEEIPDMDDDSATATVIEPIVAAKSGPVADDDLPDLDELALPDEDDDDAVATNTLSHRTYDLYITYDKYYRTPRLWLSGYSESGTPLPPSSVLDDVMGDYARKTVTVEKATFLGEGVDMPTVHPCRHAEVMKRVIERADVRVKEKAAKKEADGNEEGLRVDQYLVVFLKFMASVIPTIEHDQTMGF
ncbi:E2-like enzyme [Saitoella coloradoensis]